MCDIIMKSGYFERMCSKTSGWVDGCSNSGLRIGYSNKKNDALNFKLKRGADHLCCQEKYFISFFNKVRLQVGRKKLNHFRK